MSWEYFLISPSEHPHEVGYTLSPLRRRGAGVTWLASGRARRLQAQSSRARPGRPWNQLLSRGQQGPGQRPCLRAATMVTHPLPVGSVCDSSPQPSSARTPPKLGSGGRKLTVPRREVEGFSGRWPSWRAGIRMDGRPRAQGDEALADLTDTQPDAGKPLSLEPWTSHCRPVCFSLSAR